MTLLSEVREIKGSLELVPASTVWRKVEENPGKFSVLYNLFTAHPFGRRNQIVSRELKKSGWVRLGSRNSVPLWGESDAE
ncbi:hypothetical protein ACKUB1_13710 [Methanospirillum stamsii]|uniref:Uncharacterized protein n=1 Tax=Methanospirillum stamsii TaxID=1277351 RepID=A0A2V2NB35_9EURY|nr:hypothetical protein [Methanospirillum stamsii]PWR74836.1 hypothetical protein DLD82_08030 [Methanospirillum stamsii]